MANGYDSFSMSIEQESTTVPPPRETPTASLQSLLNSLRSTSLTHQETATCLRSLTNVMTSSKDEDEALFQEVISKLNGSEFLSMASLLTSISYDHYFMEMARNKNGSIRLQKLLGKSDDADTLICAAILRHFRHVMTDEHASRVATRAMRVVSSFEKRTAMRDQIVLHAVHLACDRHGSIALNAIIADVAFLFYSDALIDAVASNALLLSNDAYGNFVVQHVLKHCGLRRTYKIGVSLRGHYVELSFTERGRYIVEKLLERDVETEALVMAELLECEGDELVSLARSVYGHFVVETALKVTRLDLCKGLVNKLKPFIPLLRRSHQSTTIVEILESFVTN